ncbi:MAG: thermosome subunit [Methanosarcinales archaeon]|nr:MAG: thermosome subunit [Methanosarcinales archaeon]
MAGQITQPMVVIDPSKERTQKKDAIYLNINAAMAVANTVKSTFGPSGMDKMLVDAAGDITITNDGETILRKIDVEHPSAKTIVAVASTQEKEAGDGTTAAVMFAGELLKEAGKLVEQGVHPTTIRAGYKLAEGKSQEILRELATNVAKDNAEILQNIASTAMVGKVQEGSALAPLCVQAAQAVEENGIVDVANDILIKTSVGKRIEDSELITGIVIDKSRVNSVMPKRVENARIALLTSSIEYRKFGVMPGGKSKDKVKISSPDQMQGFYDGEETSIKSDIDTLYNIGTNVVFTTKSITEFSQGYLIKRGILGVARLRDGDLEAISRATGANIISNIVDVEESDLGTAGRIEEKGGEDEELMYITGCTGPHTVSIIAHGSTVHVVNTVEGALNDALRVVADTITDGEITAGGGACEIELSLRLKTYAATIGGKEQLAVNAFADALETIPYTLVDNAGFDADNLLTALKSKHIEGGISSGINVYSGEVVDMHEQGIIEPLRVKTQLLKSATDAATMILKIDDIFAATRKEMAPGPGQAPHDYDRF